MTLRHCVARCKKDRVWAAGMHLLPAERLADVESDIAELRARLGKLLIDAPEIVAA